LRLILVRPLAHSPGMKGSILAFAFGLWFVLLPRSVIRFYTWFHGGSVKLPPPSGVRLAGGIWCLFIVVLVALIEMKVI
jgi:hypothetical protein